MKRTIEQPRKSSRFPGGTSGKNQAQAEQRLRDTLLSLDKLGIKVRVEEDTVAQIIKTQGKLESFGDRQALEDKVSKLDAVDFLGKQELASVATMISLSDKLFLEWLELQKELRRLLRGLLTAKVGPTGQKQVPENHSSSLRQTPFENLAVVRGIAAPTSTRRIMSSLSRSKF